MQWEKAPFSCFSIPMIHWHGPRLISETCHFEHHYGIRTHFRDNRDWLYIYSKHKNSLSYTMILWNSVSLNDFGCINTCKSSQWIHDKTVLYTVEIGPCRWCSHTAKELKTVYFHSKYIRYGNKPHLVVFQYQWYINKANLRDLKAATGL